MKRIITIILCCLLMVSLAGCGTNTTDRFCMVLTLRYIVVNELQL